MLFFSRAPICRRNTSPLLIKVLMRSSLYSACDSNLIFSFLPNQISLFKKKQILTYPFSIHSHSDKLLPLAFLFSHTYHACFTLDNMAWTIAGLLKEAPDTLTYRSGGERYAISKFRRAVSMQIAIEARDTTLCLSVRG